MTISSSGLDGPNAETGISGRTALVTGGGTGIGLACATRLAAEGAHVTICGRTAATLADAAGSIAAALGGGGGSVRHLVADVTVEDQVAEAVAFAAEPAGGLDILLANAGGSRHLGPLADADADAVRATIDLNLRGTVLCIKHAVPVMKGRGGSIIAVSSGAGAFPHRYLWAYGAAKAGIDMLCRSAAEELGEHGIRVNSVQPGIVDDQLMAFITAGGPLLDDYLAGMPLGRVGQVDDIAAAVRFLAGPESSWITGVNLPIDGGHHLRAGANYGLLADG
jgi:NAD(P)-dependent dehydrogenase (short-subunit alcohol dehydrogenase family)